MAKLRPLTNADRDKIEAAHLEHLRRGEKPPVVYTGPQIQEMHEFGGGDRQMFIAGQIGLKSDAPIVVALSAMHTAEKITEKMEAIDRMNDSAKPLGVTYSKDKAERRGALHAPEVLIPATRTVDVNWGILQSNHVKFAGEGIPKNRIAGLLVKTETLQANVGLLAGNSVDMTDAGDLLGAKTDDLKTAVASLRGEPEMTSEKIRGALK